MRRMSVFTLVLFWGIALALVAPLAASALSGWTAQTSGTTSGLVRVDFTDVSHGCAVGDAGAIRSTGDGGTTWGVRSSGTTQHLKDVVFVDATHGWAVGFAGTVRVTANGGASWSAQVSGTTQDLRGVAFVDATHGWAVGDAGTIRVTTNGGATWSAQSSGTTQTLDGVHFTDTTHGWAVGANRTILATTDGGATWSTQTSGVTADHLYDIDFVGPGRGWAVGTSGTILTTADGGAAWTLQTSGTTETLTGVVFTDASHGWAVGHGGTVVATSDLGAAWTTQSTGTTQAFFDVDFADALHGWAVGASGTVYATSTGGAPPAPVILGFSPLWGIVGSTVTLSGTGFSGATEVAFGGTPATSFTVDSDMQITATVPVGARTGVLSVTTPSGTGSSMLLCRIVPAGDGGWTAQDSGTAQHLMGVAFVGGSQGWAVGFGGTILATSDGGGTWSAQTSGTPNRLYGVDFTDASRGWVVGGDTDGNGHSTILATTDGGATWSRQSTNAMRRMLYGVDFSDASNGWAVGVGGAIFATTNGGAVWREQSAGTTQDLYSVAFADATHGWAVGAGGTILTTVNGGVSWSAQTSGTTQDLWGVTFIGASDGWAVGYAGTMLSTSDGGATWAVQDSGTGELLSRVTFADASRGWVAGFGGTILATGDGGATWTAQRPGTGEGLTALACADASNAWVVGTNGAILATTTGGAPPEADGHIIGAVTNGSGAGLAGITVDACTPILYGWDLVSSVQTAPGGTYDLFVTPGTYYLRFSDAAAVYATETYSERRALGEGDPVTVGAGETRPGVDAVLGLAGRVTGKVLGPTGTPLAGVQVQALLPLPEGTEVSEYVDTAADGTYTLRHLSAGSWRVCFVDSSGTYPAQYFPYRASLDDASFFTVTAGATTSGIDATLGSFGHITGTVTDGTAGVSGVPVRAWAPNGSSWRSYWSTTTGSGGTYDLGSLPPGTYDLQFGGGSSYYLTTYYSGKTSLATADDVSVTAGATTTGIDTVVVLGGRISGTAGAGAGAGLSGIRVSAYRADGTGGYLAQATSGAGGTYSLGPLPAGAVKVGFADPGGTYAEQYFAGKPTRSAGDVVAVTAGATTPGIDADMTPGAHVRGTVRDADGVVAGVWVTAYRASGTGYEFVLRATTAADGSYDLGPLPPGPLSIQFWDNGGAHVSEWYDNKTSFATSNGLTMVVGGTVSDVDALLEKAGWVSGTVSGPGGGALSGIFVRAWRDDGAGWMSVNSTTTRADGTYTIGGVGEGACRIQFTDSSGAYVPEYYDDAATRDAADDVPVTAGATHSGVDAVLASAGRVSGTVADAGGPLSGAAVNAYVSDGAGGWTSVGGATTKAGGAYDIGGLAPGKYRIRFSDSSGDHVPEYYDDKPSAEAADPVSVNAGATTPGIDALLEQGGHITGTVTDGSTGLSAMWVRAWRDSGAGSWELVKTTATRDGGVYHLGGLPPGDYRVQFTDPDQVYAVEYYDDVPWLGLAADVPVSAGATTPGIDAALALTGHIEGMVTDSAGTPVEGMDAIAYRPDGAGGWEEYGSALTGVDGSYDVLGLPPGPYKIGFDVRSSELTFAPEFYDDHVSLVHAGVVTVHTGTATTGIDAVVEGGGVLDGWVTNAEGWIDATVSVYAASDSAGEQWDRVAEAYTNDGYFRLVLSPGDYRVRFSAPAYATEYSSDAPSLALADPVTVTEASTTHVSAELASGAQIRGTVTGEGAPTLAGVEVSAYLGDGAGGWDELACTTTTRSDGQYTLDRLAAGTYRIRFVDLTGGHIGEYYDSSQSLAGAQSIVVAGSSITDGIDAWLAAAGRVIGRVTDGTSGIAGITVTAYRAGGSGGFVEVASTRSGSAGEYGLGGLPTGTFVIGFRDDGCRYAAEYYEDKTWPELAAGVNVTEGGMTWGIDAALVPGGGLSGTMTVASGAARSAAGTTAAGMSVTAYRAREGVWKPVASILSSRSGTYAFSGLAPDTYRVGFSDPAGELATVYYDGKMALALSDPVVVSSDVTTPGVDAELAAGGRVAGTVTDSDGVGLAGIAVTAERLGPAGWVPVATEQTGVGGSYEIAGLAPATYRVGFADPAGNYLAEYYDERETPDLAEPVVVSPGVTTPSIDAALSRPGVVVTAPTAASSWPSGSTQTVAWTVSPAVSDGEFRVSLVSSAGTWYVNKQVLPIAGRTSYSTQVIAAAPAAAGYKAAVYWRPVVGGGAWKATAKSSAFTITPINITVPSATTVWPTQATQAVSWNVNPAMSGGEFRVSLISSGGTWYVNKQVLATTGKTSYSTSVSTIVPAGTYRAAVYWRATVGSGAWTATQKSASFTVATLSITSPTAVSTWRRNSAQSVTWTVTPALTVGEFRVSLVSQTGVWYVNKSVAAVPGQKDYNASILVSVPAGPGYKAAVYWRPTSGAGGWILTKKSAAFTVTP